MAEIPPLPVVRDSLLEENPALKAYHGQISEFFKDLTSAMTNLTLADNFSTTSFASPVSLSPGENGQIEAQNISCPVPPKFILYSAEEVDADGRGTGRFTSGYTRWSIATGVNGNVAQVQRCPGLEPTYTYNVTFTALLG